MTSLEKLQTLFRSTGPLTDHADFFADLELMSGVRASALRAMHRVGQLNRFDGMWSVER